MHANIDYIKFNKHSEFSKFIQKCVTINHSFQTPNLYPNLKTKIHLTTALIFYQIDKRVPLLEHYENIKMRSMELKGLLSRHGESSTRHKSD